MEIRRSTWALGAVCLLLASSTTSFAQKPAKGQKLQGRKGAANMATLPVDSIDAVVKLTPDQKTKITAIHDKYAADSKPLKTIKGASADPANAQKLREFTTQANKDIFAVLTPEQQTTLQAASKNMSSLNGVGLPPALAMELKLTDDQKTKLAEISREVRERVKAGAKKKDAVTELKPKIEAILTAEQKATVTKYVAEHSKRKRKKV